MGMDVYGKNGNYFRASVWSWRPIADYVQHIAPEITKACTHWQSNDGDGLDAEASVALADALDAELRSGNCDQIAAAFKEGQDALPDEPCIWCNATGIRTDLVGKEHEMHLRTCPPQDSDGRPNPRAGQMGWCNACNGAGHSRPIACAYRFDVDMIEEFSQFCRNSGGFEIS